jgi:hypothetical protein
LFRGQTEGIISRRREIRSLASRSRIVCMTFRPAADRHIDIEKSLPTPEMGSSAVPHHATHTWRN